jgi:hypothetical protein
LGILRWVGPTQALAASPDLDVLVGAVIHLTTVNYWRAPRGDSAAHLGVIRFLSGLRKVDVSRSLFELPRGYSEVPH